MWLHLRLLEACNLKCRHCYAYDRTRDAVMDFDLYKEAVDLYSQKVGRRPGDTEKRIMLSGGEPLLHKDFRAMLEYACTKTDITRISILTNGILVPQFIDFLSPFKDRIRIQISVEGGRALDDEIRGKGHYEKALKALELLSEGEFDHHISYTISKQNMGEYRNIIDLAKRYGLTKNNMSPYIGDVENMLSFDEWEDFKEKIRQYAAEVNLIPPASPRCCGWTYFCAAFIGGLTINPDGSLTGCARDNRVVGNYKDIEHFYIKNGYYMHSTCMRNKWTANDKERISMILCRNNETVTAQTN